MTLYLMFALLTTVVVVVGSNAERAIVALATAAGERMTVAATEQATPAAGVGVMTPAAVVDATPGLPGGTDEPVYACNQ